MATRILISQKGANTDNIFYPLTPPIKIGPKSKIAVLNFSANFNTFDFNIKTGINDSITFSIKNNVNVNIHEMTITLPAGVYSGNQLAAKVQELMNYQTGISFPPDTYATDERYTCEQGAEMICKYIDSKFVFTFYLMSNSYPYILPSQAQVKELYPQTYSLIVNGTAPTGYSTIEKNQYLLCENIPALQVNPPLQINNTTGVYTKSNFPYQTGSTITVQGANLTGGNFTAAITTITENYANNSIDIQFAPGTITYVNNALPITALLIYLNDSGKTTYIELHPLSFGPSLIACQYLTAAGGEKMFRFINSKNNYYFKNDPLAANVYTLLRTDNNGGNVSANLLIPNNIACADKDEIYFRKQGGKIYIFITSYTGVLKLGPNSANGNNIITLDTDTLNERIRLQVNIHNNLDTITNFKYYPSISQLGQVPSLNIYESPEITYEDNYGLTPITGATCNITFPNNKTKLLYGFNNLSYTDKDVTGLNPTATYSITSNYYPSSLFFSSPIIVIRLNNLKIASYGKNGIAGILASFPKNSLDNLSYLSQTFDPPNYLKLNISYEEYLNNLSFRIENDNGEVLDVSDVNLTILVD